MTAMTSQRAYNGYLQTQFNGSDIKSLFQRYEEIGFLYPAKKKILAPHLDVISNNWSALQKSDEELLWIFTSTAREQRDFASVCAWKYNNYGLQAQHLVSNGNPLLSLKIMMASQYKAEHLCTAREVRSSQNWFRPENRYAFRVFASMYRTLGPDRAFLKKFRYVQLGLGAITKPEKKRYIIREIDGVNLELIRFVNQTYGKVYCQAEELDQRDIQLHRLNNIYQKYGLERSRKVFLVKCQYNQKVVACAIANKAPLGLNFSFLENRLVYIIDESLDANARKGLLMELNHEMSHSYQSFPLGVLPIVTDEITGDILINQGAAHFKDYMQSIWLREGFSQWFDHIKSFYDRIKGRVRQ